MSVRVLSKVLRESQAEHGARLVLIVLADAASDDGVCWVGQVEIAEKAKLSARPVRDALRALEDLGELETRRAQRGRRRINVYRVTLSGLPDVEYDRLPFEVSEPFGRPAESAAGQDGTTGGIAPRRPAESRRSPSRVQSRTHQENRKGPLANARGARADDLAPPELLLIDGRNLPHDALAAACGIQPGSPRHSEVAAALNGSRSTGPGIRALAWASYSNLVARGDLRALEPEQWEEALAHAITLRAGLWTRKMGDATLTPPALAKWWTDLPAMADRRDRASDSMTPAEILARGGLERYDGGVRRASDDPPRADAPEPLDRARRDPRALPDVPDATRDR